MTDRIRLLLVDDQRLLRDGLRTLMELEDDLEVVGEADNGQEALLLYERLLPDVILMDVRMPVFDGVTSTRLLIERWPNARVIILTTFDDDEYVFDGLRAGARGYLLKAVSAEELAGAIRTVAAGGALIDPSVTRKVMAEFSRMGRKAQPVTPKLVEPLTDREKEILQLIGNGYTNKEIAGRLFLAEGTVKNYVTNILGKIEARDRTQAALKAREMGLL